MPPSSPRSSQSPPLLVIALTLAMLPAQAAVGQDRPAPSTAEGRPGAGEDTRPVADEARQGGRTTDGEPTPDPAPTPRPEAGVAPDDDTEGGRCRVISKRKLFGGVFLYRKCGERDETAGT